MNIVDLQNVRLPCGLTST